MSKERKKPLSEDEFRQFGQALMQVSKDELAEVIAAEDRDKPEKRRGRPGIGCFDNAGGPSAR